MTSSGADPAPAPGPPRSVGTCGPWPDGFRGIGGHLIRPPAHPNPDPEPLAIVSSDWIASSHGAHMLAPISANEDGARTAACPVCVALALVPPTGGWVEVRCSACGTEFVATDGSPPPALPPPPPPPRPARPSPLAPPSDSFPPLPDEPRSFTSDVRTDDTGRRFVRCPLCRGPEIAITGGEEIAAFPTCPACHRSFLVNLPRDDAPDPPTPAGRPAPVFDADGRLWDYCPNCGLSALTPGRVGGAFVLTCGICGQQIVVNLGPFPPRHPPLPAPPTIWERIRRWFFGE